MRLIQKIVFITLFGINGAFAQKLIVDTTAIKEWPSLEYPAINNNGTYVLYTEENYPVGKRTLMIQSTRGHWKCNIVGVSEANFINDNKRAILLDSNNCLSIITLGTLAKLNFKDVSSYKLSNDTKGEWVAYQRDDTTKSLILYNLLSGQSKKFDNVNDYLFNKSGSILLVNSKEKDHESFLRLIDLNTVESRVIYKGNTTSCFVFDHSGKQLVFMVSGFGNQRYENELWYYKMGGGIAVPKINRLTNGIDTNLFLPLEQPQFNKNDQCVFFNLSRKKLQLKTLSTVNIWNYKDIPLQSDLSILKNNKICAFINLENNFINQFGEYVTIFDNTIQYSSKYLLYCDFKGINQEYWWSKDNLPDVYIISTIDGSRRLVKSHVTSNGCYSYFGFPPSPDGNYFIYFDNDETAFYSINATNGAVKNLTGSIPTSFVDNAFSSFPPKGSIIPVGIGMWVKGDNDVLLYDNYDIWKIDPRGIRHPINITCGVGSKHNIRLRIVGDQDSLSGASKKGTLLLTALNDDNKFNGYYEASISIANSPRLMTIGPYNYYHTSSQLPYRSWTSNGFQPIRARKKPVWLVGRMSATEPMNYYLTKDFKKFEALSNLQPQKKYNWLTSELIKWKDSEGKMSSGVLYKPENFDPQKKYPLIFNYYERLSEMAYDFLTPELVSSNINIPYFVSRGYLVFIPDIHYSIGHPGKSALRTLLGARRYLSKMPWIDSLKMGIDGHSFGGYETNYIITHTELFCAAAEAAGQTDFVSCYNELTGTGVSRQFVYETSQSRIGKTLWENPELFIENSPIFYADHMRTPLLMMHNKNDFGVPFDQATELFIALRRLGKKAWMLSYDGEGHTINNPRNALDYTIRLSQFFDHFLKGAPPPKWMTQGIPAKMKGIEDGLELDTSGRQP